MVSFPNHDNHHISEDFRDRTLEFQSICHNLKTSSNNYSNNAHKYHKQSNAEKSQFQAVYQLIISDFRKLDLIFLKLQPLINDISKQNIDEIAFKRHKSVLDRGVAKNQKNIERLRILLDSQTDLSQMLSFHNKSIVSILEMRLFKFTGRLQKEMKKYKQILLQENISQHQKFSQPTVMRRELEKEGNNNYAPDADSEMNDYLTAMPEQTQNFAHEYERMKQIDEEIIQVGEVTQRIHHIILQDKETILRITDNLDHANLNFDLAHNELNTYMGKLKRNRKMIIKFGIILVVFVLIYLKFF